MQTESLTLSQHFDIVGDVHGCIDELEVLLLKLGYQAETQPLLYRPPANRQLIFVGDLVDRGPNAPACLQLAMNMVAAGYALCIQGNHENKLAKALQGRAIKVGHGLDLTLAQLAPYHANFKQAALEFIHSLPYQLSLDSGQLVIAHAGLPEALHGVDNTKSRAFSLYGKTTGKLDAHGLPERLDWAADYCGDAKVVYGHTPVTTATWRNNTLCIDTGCVFGGHLTALRYPELEQINVPAQQRYFDHPAYSYFHEHISHESR